LAVYFLYLNTAEIFHLFELTAAHIDAVAKTVDVGGGRKEEDDIGC
jgi:hypothetical protein